MSIRSRRFDGCATSPSRDRYVDPPPNSQVGSSRSSSGVGLPAPAARPRLGRGTGSSATAHVSWSSGQPPQRPSQVGDSLDVGSWHARAGGPRKGAEVALAESRQSRQRPRSLLIGLLQPEVAAPGISPACAWRIMARAPGAVRRPAQEEVAMPHTRSKRDRREWQMRPRSQRSWRDETNPRGPTTPAEEPGPAGPTESEPAPSGPVTEGPTSGPIERSPSTAGPGGGGKTEWSGRAKRHQGLHGSPSRKP